MTTLRDKSLMEHILKHYDEMSVELWGVDTLEKLQTNSITKKAIEFDLIQIAECVNSLSEEIVSRLPKADVRGLINIRNYIVHGYADVKDAIIWNSVQTELPGLINAIREVM